eukprot:scaffold674_cov119-Isochrysis_galbana.AAC.5
MLCQRHRSTHAVRVVVPSRFGTHELAAQLLHSPELRPRTHPRPPDLSQAVHIAAPKQHPHLLDAHAAATLAGRVQVVPAGRRHRGWLRNGEQAGQLRQLAQLAPAGHALAPQGRLTPDVPTLPQHLQLRMRARPGVAAALWHVVEAHRLRRLRLGIHGLRVVSLHSGRASLVLFTVLLSKIGTTH